MVLLSITGLEAALLQLMLKQTAFGVSRLLDRRLGNLCLLALKRFPPLKGGCLCHSVHSPGLEASTTMVGRLRSERPVLVRGIHGLDDPGVVREEVHRGGGTVKQDGLGWYQLMGFSQLLAHEVRLLGKKATESLTPTSNRIWTWWSYFFASERMLSL
jgi:hypothetical protein